MFSLMCFHHPGPACLKFFIGAQVIIIALFRCDPVYVRMYVLIFKMVLAV